MSGNPYLTPALFQFFNELRENNSKEWFEANKARYTREVRDPLLDFIRDFQPQLERVSPRFVANPRAAGGSLFRIHRDVRFSKDKSPYKTHAGIQFRHEAGKDAYAPGFYLHLAPGEVFAGVGMWHPDAPSLLKVWQAIVARPEVWRQAVHEGTFAARSSLGGESMKRPPRGFPIDHPFVEDLKRKDYIGGVDFTEEDALSATFMERFAQVCQDLSPLPRFLLEALGLPWT